MYLRPRMLLATLWVGSAWTIGYLVAPTLFATLADSMQAGSIAGSLFRIEAWLSVACAAAMLLLLAAAARKDGGTGYRAQMIIVAAMLACTVIGYFGLQPFMAALRETAAVSGAMSAAARTQFGVLHGIASALYLIQSLLGVALVWKMK